MSAPVTAAAIFSPVSGRSSSRTSMPAARLLAAMSRPIPPRAPTMARASMAAGEEPGEETPFEKGVSSPDPSFPETFCCASRGGGVRFVFVSLIISLFP
jgi:putative hemolysin